MAGIKVNSGTHAPAGSSKTEQGCEFIRNKIRSGEWPAGYKLPSQAVWATGNPGLKLLYGTLRGAYIILKTEGWIYGQQGEGVFVSEDNPHAKAAVAKKTVATKKRT